MFKILGFDNSFQILNKKRNDKGYLVLKCTFARTGIQERLGAEISPELEPTKIFKEFRSPDEVFKPEVLEGFRTSTITNDHPEEALNTLNTTLHAKGFVSSSIEVIDNSYLGCEITIYDEETTFKQT